MMILGCGTGSVPHQNRVRDVVTDLRADERVPGTATEALPWRNARQWIARCDPHDIATVALLAALLVIALLTYRDYAISNDEGVQHRYGELIIAYYRSGFADQSSLPFPEPLSLWRPVRRHRHRAQSGDPDQSLRSAPYPVRAGRHRRDRRSGCDRAIDRGSPRRPDRGDQPDAVRRVVWLDVQPYQGHSFRRRDDGGDPVSDPHRAPSAIAPRRRYCHIRPACRRGAWHSGDRLAAGRLHWLCDRPVSAASVVGPPPHVVIGCDQIDGADIARAGACLCHHDPGLALGRAGAAQPVPWPARILRVQLRHPDGPDRPDLQHG